MASLVKRDGQEPTAAPLFQARMPGAPELGLAEPAACLGSETHGKSDQDALRGVGTSPGGRPFPRWDSRCRARKIPATAAVPGILQLRPMPGPTADGSRHTRALRPPAGPASRPIADY